MKRFCSRWPLLAAALAVLALAAGASAARKPLSYQAYNGWRSIQSAQLARDGSWLVYALAPQDGDGELVVRNLKTDKEFRSPRGQAPVLTADGRFVVFTIAPVKAELDKAKKDKKKPEEQPKNGLGIMSLATGDVTVVERGKSFKVPEDGGAWIAYLLEPPLKKDEKKEEAKAPEAKAPDAKPAEEAKKPKEKKKEPGSVLNIRDLAGGRIVAEGSPEDVAANRDSSTGAYLRRVLETSAAVLA